MFKKLLFTILLTMEFSSCYITIGERGHHQGQADFEVNAYLVENGIGERYRPWKLVLCSNEEWVLVAWDLEEPRNTFFFSPDGGRNWEYYSELDVNLVCEEILMYNDVLFCAVRNCSWGLTPSAKSSRILQSKNHGLKWKELLVVDGNVEHLMVVDSTISFQLCTEEKEGGNDTFKINHTIHISNDMGARWRILKPDVPFTSAFSGDKIIVGEYGDRNTVLEISPALSAVDTIHTDFYSMVQIIKGEDIIGAWNGGKADYFRIVSDSLVFLSRIRFERLLSDYIPEEIYQSDDIVYTSVLRSGYAPKYRMFASHDRAGSWTPVSTRTEIDKQLDSIWTPEGDAWFMAGYKDRMVSYCVGYKDGRRQDFIKVIKPK